MAASAPKALLIQHPSPRTTFSVHLGLGYLAAALKAKGFEVKCVDATAPYSRHTLDSIARLAEKENFDLIGVTVTTIFAVFAYDLLSRLAGRTKALLVAGGPHVTMFPREALDRGAAVAVIGEGEETIGELADHVRGLRPLEGIMGIAFLGPDGLVLAPPRPLIHDLDSLPFPDKDSFIKSDFIRYPDDINKYNNIISSRGCPARCTYCSKAVFGRSFRYRSPENILAEIKHLNEKYGITHFSFVDDAMAYNRPRVDRFCELVKKEITFKFTWSCVNRVDLVSAELLAKLKDAGCVHINYGIETANPETLKKINKDISLDKVERALEMTHRAGIEYSVNFMWGFPWEQPQEIDNSIVFMKKVGAKASWINTGGILIPFPGTEIYDTYKNSFPFENWWLRREQFTGQYRLRATSPMFRYYFFDDQGLMEGNGYFNYSAGVKKKIMEAIDVVGSYNLRKQSRVFYYLGLAAVRISRITYSIHYRAELVFQKLFYGLLHLKRLLRPA